MEGDVQEVGVQPDGVITPQVRHVPQGDAPRRPARTHAQTAHAELCVIRGRHVGRKSENHPPGSTKM